MTLNNIFKFLVPKDKKFFPLFEQAAAGLILLADALHEAVNAPKMEREEYFRKIEELEAEINICPIKYPPSICLESHILSSIPGK